MFDRGYNGLLQAMHLHTKMLEKRILHLFLKFRQKVKVTQAIENLIQLPCYLDESTYKYYLVNHVLKACGDMYDNHILPPHLHPMDSQSAFDN